MMKFFRKYNKQMLAVFMALLLIVWLGGDALQYFLNPDRSGDVVATSQFGTISREEWNRLENQTVWMTRLNLPWQVPLGRAQTAELDVPAWVLLTQEAHQMGIRSSRPVVQNLLSQLRINDAVVTRLAQQSNVKTDVIYDAATAFTDVWRYLGKMSTAANVNEAELRQSAQEALSKVQVNALVLPAKAFEDPEASFSEGEIQEQFDKYKDKKRTGDGLNFGNMLPARVKVEYVKVEPAQVEDKVPESEKLIKEARAYWSKNKETDPVFRRPEEDLTSQPAEASSQPAEATSQLGDASSQPTSQPASQPAKSPFFTKWEEAREGAIKVIRKREAAKEAQKVAEWLVAQAGEPWMHAETGTDRYKVAPAGVQKTAYYEELLKTAPATLKGIEAAGAMTTDWISQDKMADLKGIGTASMPNPSGVPLSFRQLAFSVQGLAVIPTGEDAARIDTNLFLTKHQTYRYVLQDDDGNLYVFRVIDVDGERPPRDLAEVRDQVVADLRLAKAFAEAQAAAESIREKTATQGLKAAWEADTELQQKVTGYTARAAGAERGAREAGFHELSPIARRSFGSAEPVKFVPKLGQVNEEFLSTCFELGKADATGSRVKNLAMPESGTAVVVEWVKDLPAEQNQFATMRPFLSSRLQETRKESYLASWIAPQQVRARNKFEFKSSG